MSIFEKDGFIELLRSILPLVTFILGQALAKLDKNKEKRDSQVILVESFITQLGYPVLKSLHKIETKLANEHNYCEAREKPDGELYREAELKTEFLVNEIEKLVENVRARLNTLDTVSNDDVTSILLCVKSVQSHASNVQSHASNVIVSLLKKKPVGHKIINELLRRSWELTIENHECILFLAKEILSGKPERYKTTRKSIIHRLEKDKIRISDEKENYESIKIPLGIDSPVDIGSNYQPSYSPGLDYPATYLKSILLRIQELDKEFDLQLRTIQELRPSVNKEEYL